MLDIMGMRGFTVLPDHNGRQYLLVTPDGTGYAVQLFHDVSLVQCVFEAFQTINHMFP
jgi:hypothetical protein